MSNGEVLEVDGLMVRFANQHRPAVDDLSFALGPAETLAIVGESGSGKSTTAMAVARLLPPSSDLAARSMRFETADLLAMGADELRSLRGRRMGFVFQDPLGSWNPSRRIGPQLIDGLEAAGVGGDHRERLEGLFDRVGIPEPSQRLDDYPHEMSGGMLQRAMIAGAVAGEPSLLLADEPTSALDATVQQEILELLRELQRELGLAIILISHDLWVVRRTSARVLVLYGGIIVERGPTDGVLEQPLHPYTQGLIASAPGRGLPPKTRLPAMPPGAVGDAGCPFAPRCPLATEQCNIERPVLRQVGDHEVACHEIERAAGVWTR